MARADRDDHFLALKSAAEAQGWAVEETAKKHWKFVPPHKGVTPVFYSGSPSDWRAIRNFVAAMRQRGFQLPKSMRKGG